MSNTSATIVQHLWNYCNVLPDDGVSYGDHMVSANLTRAERLRQSILKQAFEGKLVPQDPNDEPANVLLERIRMRRAAATPVEAAPAAKRARRTARAKRSP